MDNVKLVDVQKEQIEILKDINATLLEELAKWRAFGREKHGGSTEL